MGVIISPAMATVHPATDPRLQILEQEPLSRHCRFAVGGPADYFVKVSDEQGLLSAVDFARSNGLRHFVYAGGSNLFFDDAGFRGLVVKLEGGGWELDAQSAVVKVTAGYDLGTLVRELAAHDLGGIEFLANIPGSVGGAVVGNAGCYGRSIAEILVAATVCVIDRSEVLSVEPDYFGFEYRHSRLKYDGNQVLIDASFRLGPRSGAEILCEVEEELSQRRIKHPHEAQCAGSFFKNPSRERPAWRLITEAGLAEARVGGARLDPKHANFLVNADAASSADIISLAMLVRAKVQEALGFELHTEVRYVSPLGVEDLC